MTRALILTAAFAILLALEAWRPLRKAGQPKLGRVATNLGIAAVAALTVRAVTFPPVYALSQWAEKSQVGLLPALSLPSWLAAILALAALDYTLYLWHWMNHKVRFLWRFHNVHHVDLDLDVSTATRFHWGELLLSAVYRSAQIVVIGVSPGILILFESLVTGMALFHHSNLALPARLDRALNRGIVTPRMHSIHHSIVQKETDSNYSAVSSVWDRLHGTLRQDIPQEAITIGVPAYRERSEVTFLRSMLLPFQKPRPWQLPGGAVPRRELSEFG